MTKDKINHFVPSDNQTKAAIKLGLEKIKYSHSPYSKFKVCAVMMDEFEKLHVGVNIENASYSLTICGEASAIAQLITSGAKKIIAVWLVSDIDDCVLSACGACRQRIFEFAQGPETLIISCNRNGVIEKNSISQLLPKAFSL